MRDVACLLEYRRGNSPRALVRRNMRLGLFKRMSDVACLLEYRRGNSPRALVLLNMRLVGDSTTTKVSIRVCALIAVSCTQKNTDSMRKKSWRAHGGADPGILPQGAIQASSRKARDYQGIIGQFLPSCRRHAKVGPPLHLNQDSYRRGKKRYCGLWKIIPCEHHFLDHFHRRGIVSLSPTSFIIVVFLMLRYSFLAHETIPSLVSQD
jgi:hypothetical protein